MSGSNEQVTWRNVARYEESFNDAVYEQVKATPWYVTSLAFHAFLIFLMFQLAWGEPPQQPQSMVKSAIVQRPLKPLKELVKPAIQRTRPIEQKKTVVRHPVMTDDPPSDHNESDNDQKTHRSLGDPRFISNAPFKSPYTFGVIGEGPGAGGAFGQRFGGSKNLGEIGIGGRRTQKAVELGLGWLKRHQDPNGYWDCNDFMKMCKLSPPCTGPGGALYDPGVTGLALLAFLGTGNTYDHGPYHRVVRDGLKYLKGIQDGEGCFGPRTDQRYVYNTAIDTLAMAEAYGMTHSPLFKQTAQQGIDFVLKAQNPYLAWRYGVQPQDNDTSVSGWMIMALKSGKLAGLRVGEAGFDGMKAWLDQMTDPQYGKVGYTTRGMSPARPKGLEKRFPQDKSESLTAVGMLARIFMGVDPKKSELLQKETDLLSKCLPVWNENDGSIDMYYWYYGTLAMFQVGGEPWKQWDKAIKAAIIDHQIQSGCPKGSWDPVGPWGKQGGRVYSTALMTMCMEVYYRYPRVFGAR